MAQSRSGWDIAREWLALGAVCCVQMAVAPEIARTIGFWRWRALQAAGVTSFSVDGLSESYASPGAAHLLESAEARVLLAPSGCDLAVLHVTRYPVRLPDLSSGSGGHKATWSLRSRA